MEALVSFCELMGDRKSRRVKGSGRDGGETDRYRKCFLGREFIWGVEKARTTLH